VAELAQDREQSPLALRREIRRTRAQVVSDIDELRDALRVRLSLSHVLRAHPRFAQGLTVALALAGIATLALVWHASKRGGQADDVL
jgi:hypothetical protein